MKFTSRKTVGPKLPRETRTARFADFTTNDSASKSHVIETSKSEASEDQNERNIPLIVVSNNSVLCDEIGM